jgi:uncharacterized protein YcfL
MKKTLLLAIILGLFISCSNSNNNNKNSDLEEQEIMKKMENSLDTSNAEIVLYRDTTTN